MNRLPVFLCLAALLAGCSWLAPHRLTVNQGNVLEQETLDQVSPGMSRGQVLYLLGTPIVNDPFHLDRWDYVYSIQNGFRPRVQRRVTLFFDGEVLTAIEGDLDPATAVALREAHALDERAEVRRIQGEISQ
jgi:outer membrane protein assembly factor BamE